MRIYQLLSVALFIGLVDLTPASAVVIENVQLVLDPPAATPGLNNLFVAVFDGGFPEGSDHVQLSGDIVVDFDIEPSGVVNHFQVVSSGLSLTDGLFVLPQSQAMTIGVGAEISTPSGPLSVANSSFDASGVSLSLTSGLFEQTGATNELINFATDPASAMSMGTGFVIVTPTGVSNEYEVLIASPINIWDWQVGSTLFDTIHYVQARGTITVIPEPQSGMMLGSIAVAACWRRRRSV